MQRTRGLSPTRLTLHADSLLSITPNCSPQTAENLRSIRQTAENLRSICQTAENLRSIPPTAPSTCREPMVYPPNCWLVLCLWDQECK